MVSKPLRDRQNRGCDNAEDQLIVKLDLFALGSVRLSAIDSPSQLV